MRRTPFRSAVKLFACATVLVSSPLLAQLPITELTTIYPPGSKVGTSVEVTVGGTNQDDLTRMVFSHAGITATQKTNPPPEFFTEPVAVNNVFTVNTAGDVPPGVYEARVVGRFGTSNPRAFVVGSLEEIVDDGSNQAFDTAKEVAVGTTVNGRADANARNYFKIKLEQNQRVLIDCLAERIDSRLLPTLVLYDANRRELDRSQYAIGNDALIDFTATAAGEYVVALYDSIYSGGGDYFYRLNIHNGPQIDFVFPSAGQPGSNSQYTVYGRNLPGGKPADGLSVDGSPLQMLTTNIALPADATSVGIGGFLPSNGVLVDGAEYRLENSNSVRVGFATDPVIVETAGNDDADSAQSVQVPCEVAGQFYPERDIDWYQFEAKNGEVFWIEVIAHQLGLNSDPYLLIQRVVKNDKGEETVSDVAAVDDPGDRNGRIGTDFDTSTDDPSYRFTANADATYRIMIRDQFGDARNDPRYVYRLQIRRENPDFRLVAFPRQTKVANGNQVLSFSPVLRRGGTTLLQVDVERRDGFAGDVEVSVEGLPAGVTTDGGVLSGSQKTLWLVLAAAEDAAAWSGPIKIVGKAKVGEQDVTRSARCVSVVWGTANRTTAAPSFRVTRDLALSVMDKEMSPALVKVGDGNMLETSKGGKIDVPISVTRREGFKEAIKLIATGMPAELKPADVTINADKTDGTLAMQVTNAKAQPGIYTFYLRSDTKVKVAHNPDAIAKAEAEQKIIVELVPKVAEELKKATADRDAANKAAADAAGALKTAQAAKTAADTAAQQAADAAKQAADKLTAATQAATKEPENQGLKDAVAAAQKVVDDAEAKNKQAAETAANAAKAVTDAEAASKSAEETKVTNEQIFKDTDAKNKRVVAAKAAADKKVADVKKANAPKDINFALISTPLKIRVVESPLKLTAQAPAALKQKEKVELPVNIERLYGFADNVELTLELPKGVAGITVSKVTLNKDQKDGKLELSANDKATPGDHTVTVHAKAKFNNVAVETSQQVVVKVEAAPAAE